MVLCAPNGFILGVWGPYPGSWTDDKILTKILSEMKEKKEKFWLWLESLPNGSLLGVDAGFPRVEIALPPNIKVVFI